jgi:hypothetical protein
MVTPPGSMQVTSNKLASLICLHICLGKKRDIIIINIFTLNYVYTSNFYFLIKKLDLKKYYSFKIWHNSTSQNQAEFKKKYEKQKPE